MGEYRILVTPGVETAEVVETITTSLEADASKFEVRTEGRKIRVIPLVEGLDTEKLLDYMMDGLYDISGGEIQWVEE